MPHKQLKSIPKRLGYILGAQWTRDLSWTIFTILLAWHSKEMLGQIMLALSYGYLVKTAADVGLNDFLLSSFVRKDSDPMRLLGEVTWFKFTLLLVTLCVTFGIVCWQNYTPELSGVVMCIAAGFGLDGVSDSFFALCQAGRGNAHTHPGRAPRHRLRHSLRASRGAHHRHLRLQAH